MTAVTLEYRNVAIGAGGLVEAGGPSIHCDHPPPVRTVIGVRTSAGVRAFEVLQVFEVERPDAPRGCRGRWVERDLRSAASHVGSEHLGPGAAAVPVEAPDSSADRSFEALPVNASWEAPREAPRDAGVPAPVVVDDSVPMDAADGADPGAASDEGSAGTPMKKRKGRKRS
jgi:hypothetical protein